MGCLVIPNKGKRQATVICGAASAAELAVIAQLLVLQHAQAYPDRPIKLVVPSPAGSPPDQMARLVSDKMSANLGQPVIVDNRAGGAGGTVGAKSVVTAEPDGHSTSNLLIAPLIVSGLLAPSAMLGRNRRLSDLD